jgi:aquaporin Z
MKKKLFWIYLSECTGTALLVLVGLSVVIFNNGEGSPVRNWIPDDGVRRYLTGFLFGTTGCLITLSPVGKISGAHINPIVSLAFRLKKRMLPLHTLGYMIAQLAGSVIGACPLLLWGRMGSSVLYGATIPRPGSTLAAFTGEVITSFLLIALIFFFTGRKKLRRYTPYMIPPLYCLMVGLEGSLSGTSTNPARSFGPAVVSGVWTGHWIYWTATALGAVLAVFFFSMPFLRKWRKVLPKLYHAPASPQTA